MSLDTITFSPRLPVLVKRREGVGKRMEYLAHPFCVTGVSLGPMVTLLLYSTIRTIFAVPPWLDVLVEDPQTQANRRLTSDSAIRESMKRSRCSLKSHPG